MAETKTATGKVVASKTVKAVKTTAKPGVAADDDECGCVDTYGCCKDQGCCSDEDCPDESALEMGCAGDSFSLKLKSRVDLTASYLLENKASVVKYFKAKGVIIKQ